MDFQNDALVVQGGVSGADDAPQPVLRVQEPILDFRKKVVPSGGVAVVN